MFTLEQKLTALALRFYQHMVWTPQVGHYYCLTREGLELFQITRTDEENFFIKLVYAPGQEPGEEMDTPWPIGKFQQDFGINRVWVPDRVLGLPKPAPEVAPVAPQKHVGTSLPVAYTHILHHLAVRARELGYALALHGSMTRDLDVVAIHWVDAAVSAKELADALMQNCGGFLKPIEAEHEHFQNGSPGAKPHGRLVWSIQLGGGPYIDLSVMPRQIETTHEG
jgi:hypothetical protein